MHSDYRNPAIEQLRNQQTRYVPREKKLQQINRAEILLSELDPDKSYSYEYVCYRITDFRPEATPRVVMTGEDLQHDLRLLIEDLSDSACIKAEEVPEPVHTLDDLSKMFEVSTKTISRWRQQGLVSRRFVLNGRKRVGFLKSSVDRFVRENRQRVLRGSQFTQLTDEERDQIVDSARRLAHRGECPADVTKRVAERMNRSVETIRYTLREFDKHNPETAVFPAQSGRLTEDAKKQIFTRYRRGVGVDTLAKQYCRTRNSVYRVINEMRAKRILELPLDLIHNEEFEKKKADEKILVPMPEAQNARRPSKPPSGLPPYLASLYEVPLLTKEQEQHLFRKFNYLKYKANLLIEKMDPSRAKGSVLDEIESLYNQAVQLKNQIVQANLRLVVSIAKRHVTATEDFFTLVSDGNMSLIRAVEKFDYARGNKFSTYASWAIMKNFARTIPEEYKHRDRFRATPEELFTGSPDTRSDQLSQENAQQTRERQIDRILAALDEREQRIIISRFGLDYSQEPQTLKEVGAEIGVTKERVRQIEARALNKLRMAAAEEHIDLPE